MSPIRTFECTTLSPITMVTYCTSCHAMAILGYIQWNLSKTTTCGPVLTDLYREVAALQQGTVIQAILRPHSSFLFQLDQGPEPNHHAQFACNTGTYKNQLCQTVAPRRRGAAYVCSRKTSALPAHTAGSSTISLLPHTVPTQGLALFQNKWKQCSLQCKWIVVYIFD